MGKKHYPQIIRDEAVLFYERGHTFAETQTKYGMAESTFFEWKKKYDLEHPLNATGCSAFASMHNIPAYLLIASRQVP